MSANDPKQTFHYVAFGVAFGGKADMSLTPHMSAFDPKRTLDLMTALILRT